MKGKMPYILLVLLIIVGITSWGAGIALASQTLSSRWISLTAAAILALTSLPMTLRAKNRVKRSITQKTLRGPMHVFVAGGVGYLAILGINRLGANQGEIRNVNRRSDRTYSSPPQPHPACGCNRYVPDGHYYTYGAVVTLPDGRKTEQHLSLEEYNRTRIGAKREVTVYSRMARNASGDQHEEII